MLCGLSRLYFLVFFGIIMYVCICTYTIEEKEAANLKASKEEKEGRYDKNHTKILKICTTDRNMRQNKSGTINPIVLLLLPALAAI